MGIYTQTLFSDKLETELKVIGEDLFNSIRSNIADELGYDEPSKVLKNPQGAARFIQRIYADGQKIPVLEDIVERITNLKNG